MNPATEVAEAIEGAPSLWARLRHHLAVIYRLKHIVLMKDAADKFVPPQAWLLRLGPGVVIAYLALSALLYSYLEGWSFPDAFYFCCVAVTSVGYGDFVPTSDLSKAVYVVFMLFGLSLCASCLGLLAAKISSLFDSDSSDGMTKRCAALARPASLWRPGLGASGGHARPARRDARGRPRQRHRDVLRCVAELSLVIACGTVFVCVSEGWSVLDGVYWSVQTVTTTGFGDLPIEQEVTKRFAAWYILAGVSFFATSLTKIGGCFMAMEEDKRTHRLIQGRRLSPSGSPPAPPPPPTARVAAGGPSVERWPGHPLRRASPLRPLRGAQPALPMISL